MERKLRYLEKEIKRDDIPILDTGENPEAPQPREMIDLEAAFEKLENELREVNQNSEALKKNFLELTELKHILRKTQTFFDEVWLSSDFFKSRKITENSNKKMHTLMNIRNHIKFVKYLKFENITFIAHIACIA